MKCPKCGYISFDYNQVCPKCNKGITDEQAKMNLPSFRPDPPSLLGILIGEGGESNRGFQVDNASAMDTSDMDLSFDDSEAIMGPDEVEMGESQDLDINLEPDDSGEFELPADEGDESVDVVPDLELGEEDEGLSLDMDEISFDDSGDDTESSEADDGMEIGLELGDISLDESEPDEEDESINLEELSLDDSGPVDDGVGEETIPEMEEAAVEVDSISMEEVGEETPGEDRSEIELGLDDLKVNETGELEISSFEGPETEIGEGLELGDVSIDESEEVNEDASLDLGDLEMDEIPSEDTEATELVEDLDLGEGGGMDSEEGLELGDVTIDESVAAEEASLDLGDLEMDETPSEDTEATQSLEDFDLGDIDAEEAEESLDLEDFSLDESISGSDDLSDLEGLALGEDDSEGDEKTKVYDESPSMEADDLENLVANDSISDDSSEQDESSQDDNKEKVEVMEDGMTIDLDNLDLDLDFDDSEDE